MGGDGCLAGMSEPSVGSEPTSSGGTSEVESAILLAAGAASWGGTDSLSCAEGAGGVAPLLLGDGNRSNGSGSLDAISPLLEFSTGTEVGVLMLSKDWVMPWRGSETI